MPTANSTGLTVRHAVSRALATSNLAPWQATYRVLSSRYTPARRGRTARAEVTVMIKPPRPLAQWEPHELAGWVNPDGEHPLMTLVALDDPLFVDVFPVTWEAWLEGAEEPALLPDGLDPLAPRTGLGWDEARDWCHARGGRLPSSAELAALWGDRPFPWGERPDPGLGHAEPPRFGALHEVGMHPPVRGLWDLGAWLWHWTAEGSVAGGGSPPRFDAEPEGLEPIGFRAVLDADLS